MEYCKYCNKECKNNNSLRNHERLCKANPNRQFTKFNDNCWQKAKGTNKFIKAKKLGIEIKVSTETKAKISNSKKGKVHSEETKQKISKSMKVYLLKNPDKVPYLLNHSSKGISYPERYFKFILSSNKIYYDFQYQEGLYSLDFKINNIDLEIDGDQHYLDKKIIKHDIIRNKVLTDKGYKIIRIKWSDYKKLSRSKRELFIKNLISVLLNNI